MSKGGRFEREVCKQLSLWWSGGTRDAVFYRTPNSGGRATVRAKKSLDSVNQCGDIGASDPIGLPFLRLVAVEIKRGYNAEGSLADLLDSSSFRGPSLYERWIAQARASAQQAKVPYWMLIVRRDGKKAIVIVPSTLLSHVGAQPAAECGAVIWSKHSGQPIQVLTLDAFTEQLSPLLFGDRTHDPARRVGELPEAPAVGGEAPPAGDNGGRPKRRRKVGPAAGRSLGGAEPSER